MKKAEAKDADEMRPEYRREDLGEMVRGKYIPRLARGSNVVVLEPEIAKVFPTSEAVNQALAELLADPNLGRRRS